MSNSEIFELFKRDRSSVSRQKSIPEVFFQLVFEKNVARLLTVDKNGNAISADHRHYSGAARGVLMALESIKESAKKTITWGREEAGVNLSANGFLLWQLKRCENFIDETLKPIVFSQSEGVYLLTVDGEHQLACKLALKVDDQVVTDIQVINDVHAFHDGKIYPVSQTGIDYTTLSSFQTLILPSELEKYLSLFCSYCEGVEIIYKDFKIITGSPIPSNPSIIIEKITPDNSLYLKVVNSVPGFEPDFSEQYDINYVVLVSELDRQIEIRQIMAPGLELPGNRIRKYLNQLKSESTEIMEFYQDQNFFIVESPLSEKFVREALPVCLPEFTIFGSEKLQSYKVAICKPELDLTFDHGIDFLEGSADLVVRGEHFSLFEALHQFRKNSYIQLNDGTKAILDHEYVNKLERIFEKGDNQVKVSFFDLPLVEELIEERIKGKSFEEFSKVYKGFLELKNETIESPEISATLRPYQLNGYKWLKYLQKNSLGGCLADDMGLGKTLQAITLLASVYPDQILPSLVVVPKSLVFNWLNEINRFSPKLDVTVYYSTDRDLAKARKSQLILSTYGTVRNDIELLKDEPFYYLILDESQYIKNHESQISKAVSLLKAEHRLALSGTPIENNLAELYSLFRFLNPTMFGNLARFNRQYLFPIQQGGNAEVAKELKKKIYPFILRRLKKDVLQDLPDKIEKLIQVEMSDEQRRFYEQRRSFYYDTIRNRIESEGFKKSQFFVLQAITVLRQIASIPEVKTDGRIISPKRELLADTLEEAIANNHKVLLFANFLGVLEYLAQDLTAKGIDFETLSGSTRNREAPVKRFQTDSNCKVFLMTLKTGGQGLNLTAADTVYIFDPWWNLAAENQAIDRSHRMGQNKTVFSYKLIAKDTIEEKILRLQQKKKAVFESIISDESMSFQHFGEEDIDYLMS